MRLTVLGSSGAFPGPGHACSGYVVEASGARVVVDLGWGTLPRLFDLLGDHTGDGLDAVVITHEHPDHMADLYGLFRARWYGRRDGQPIPLLSPAGVRERLLHDHDGHAEDVARVFDWREAPGDPLAVGAVTIESLNLPHYVPNAGVRVRADDTVVAFTGDTGPSPRLADLGRDADLFVVDATDRHQQADVGPAPPGTPALNLTATEAGAAARAAGARRLMITHLWPGNDPERSRRDAAESYGDDVLVARDGLVVEVAAATGPRDQISPRPAPGTA